MMDGANMKNLVIFYAQVGVLNFYIRVASLSV